jgi:pyruvate/2-oxoglutarate dehydrogenase complex dihydrolipoamide dehydrogenase (E3) component
MLNSVGNDVHPSTKYFILKSLAAGGVEILTKTKVDKFTSVGAVCVNLNGTVDLSGYDMIILAIGAKSYNPLEKDLKDKVKSLYVIGDAVKPRKAVEAIEEAARLALEL